MTRNKKIAILLIILTLTAALVLTGCEHFDFSGGGNDDTGGGNQNSGNNISGGVSGSLDTGIVRFEVVTPTDTDSTRADVIERIHPSVVEIQVQVSATSSSAGSGVIIASPAKNETGYTYILTCQHVLDGFSNQNAIKVTLTDGTVYTATYVGGVPDDDIAVIRLNAVGLTVAQMRNVEEAPIRLGEDTIVIGNPLGTLGGTVTAGMISSTAREINVEGTVMTLLQTDASINSGNSGGAIFDESGYLIGIVNAKAAGDSVEGLGFAIPIEKASALAKDLINTANDADNPYGGLGYIPGKFTLGIMTSGTEAYNVTGGSSYLAVKIAELLEYGSLSPYLSTTSGSLYIMSLDGTRFTAYSDFSTKLKTYKVGDTVLIGIGTKSSFGGFGSSNSIQTTEKEIVIKQYVYGYNHAA